MKKTIKINIGGFVFHIDEDAYDRLESYINRLKAGFRGTQGESEIIADIESRIAEIFQSKITEEKEVINLQDVEDVISLLGEPEEIDGSDTGEEFESSSTHESHYRDARKRIYRDPNSKVIGGVCGGLGEYFRVDPLIFRIIFIISFLIYGVGFLIYILLWIVVPEARTRTEKMEMRGEAINVSNIERSIRKEYDRGRKGSYEPGETRPYRRERNGFSQLMHGIGRVILVFIKIIGGIIGVSFVIAGVAILVAIIGSLVAGHTWLINDFWDISGFSIPEVMSVFMDETVAIIALIALTALIAIPVLGLIYAGVKLLFPFRANDKAVGLSGLGIWVAALVILLILGASEGVQHNNSARSSSSREIKMDSVNQIHLTMAEEDFSSVDHIELGFIYHQDILITEKGKDLIVMGRPDLDIVKSFGEEIEIAIKKRSRGVNDDAARRLAEDIEYSYQVKDSSLILDPYFVLPEHIKWRDQEVDIILSIPVGMEIFLDKSLVDVLHNVENLDNLWYDEMVDQLWIMTDEGLTRAIEETE